MAKSRTTDKRIQPKEKTSKLKRKRDIRPAQIKQSFDQDAKGRIGQCRGAGEPPLMKKYISLAWQVLTLNYWPR